MADTFVAENDLTRANQDYSGAIPLQMLADIVAGLEMVENVSSHVTSNGLCFLALASGEDLFRSFYSHDFAFPPQLEITFNAAPVAQAGTRDGRTFGRSRSFKIQTQQITHSLQGGSVRPLWGTLVVGVIFLTALTTPSAERDDPKYSDKLELWNG